jgi:hypothetical protein
VWRAFRAITRERIAAAVAIALVLLLGGSVNGTVLLVTVDLIITATLAVEHARMEH